MRPPTLLLRRNNGSLNSNDERGRRKGTREKLVCSTDSTSKDGREWQPPYVSVTRAVEGRGRANSTAMSVYQSPDCGSKRVYVYRPMKSQVIRFRVKASHDANLCLSRTSVEVQHGMYEVFLGGWGGTESAIRRNKTDEVCRIKTPNLLSPNEFRGFWIVVTKTTIKVGREGVASPFMVHSEPLGNLQVNHFGYCTAWGARGSWTFEDDDLLHSSPNFVMKDLLGALNQIPDTIGFIYPATGACAGALTNKNKTLKWVSCCNGSKCPAPVQANHGNNQPLVAAAYHKEGLIPGVFLPANDTCYISWGGQAIAKTDYFLLSNPGGAKFTWQSARNGDVPMGALEGGYTETGEKLIIGRFTIDKTVISGKVHPSHKVCYAPYWLKEVGRSSYEVLCLKTVPFSILGIQ